ncbi:MAG: GNAT family N-acetyltransferase [Coprococcus sp.]
MDTFVIENDFKLLEKDAFTFQVLQRIMAGNCKLILADHKNFILCYSTPPFPVWIWTEDNLEEDIKELIWDTLKQYDLLKTDIKFNVKYKFAEYLICKAKEEKLGAKIITNMLAYECRQPIVPHIQAEGKVYKCSSKDVDELTQMKKAFHDAIGIDKKDDEGYRKDAEEELKSIPVYFWKNSNGDTVATCNVRIDGDKASVGQVYTPIQHRRKHYAENVVYHAAKEAFDQGYIPTLYTNADYAASNKCYQKIGFEICGSLCMVGFER